MRRGQGFEPLAIRAVADQRERPRRVAVQCQGLQQGIDSLFGHQASHIADRQPFVRLVLGSRGHRNPELRHHRDRQRGCLALY